VPQPPVDAAGLLSQLLDLPAEQRARHPQVLAHPEHAVSLLSDEVERLAVTNAARALRAAEAAVQLADTLSQPFARARARRAYAQALAYAGRFDEALPLCNDAIRIATDSGLTLEAAQGRLAAIHALVHLARYDEAIRAGEAARAAFLAAGEPFLVGRAETSLGGVYQKLDEVAAALRHFDCARPLLRGDPVALAQLDSNRGLALQSLDRFREAEAAFRAALPALEQANLAWGRAIVEGNLAVLATRQGRLQEAVYFFERERRQLEQDAAPAELARTLVEQADAMLVLRLADRALADYRAALPVLREHGQIRETLQALAGVGRALVLLGHREQAVPWLDEAAREYERLGQPVERARLDLVRAEIALEMGDTQHSLALARGSLETLADHPADAAAARYQVARAALASGELAESETELNQAIEAVERLSITPLLADLLHARGLVHRAMRRDDSALVDLQRAVEHIERVRGSLQAERFRAAFHGNRLAVYEDLVAVALNSRTDESRAVAFSAVERAKSRSLLDLVQGSVDTPVAEPADPADRGEAALAAGLGRLKAELNAHYSRLADARFSAEPSTRLDEHRNRIRMLERRVETLESRLATTRGVAGLYARSIDLDAAQAALEPGVALIEYFVADDELLAFVVVKDAVHVFRNLARSSDLDAQAQRVHFQIRRALRPGALDGHRGPRLLRDARGELKSLHDSLLAPLETALGDLRCLRIVPHGVLHTVPFHTLWDGQQHVIERWEVAYCPSASLLSKRRTATGQAGDYQAPLVIGVADSRAPLIEDEALRVAAVLKTDRLLLGQAASADRFKLEAPRTGIIHLACHGHFAAENPLGSGIRFSDRWLTVREIFELRLNAELVTLAACDTGRSVVSSGDELLGLVRGFLASGAAAVIVSLWLAGDEYSGTLMASLYNTYGSVRAGEGIATALQRVQLDAMKAHPHPAFWAPFVLIGGR